MLKKNDLVRVANNKKILTYYDELYEKMVLEDDSCGIKVYNRCGSISNGEVCRVVISDSKTVDSTRVVMIEHNDMSYLIDPLGVEKVDDEGFTLGEVIRMIENNVSNPGEAFYNDRSTICVHDNKHYEIIIDEKCTMTGNSKFKQCRKIIKFEDIQKMKDVNNHKFLLESVDLVLKGVEIDYYTSLNKHIENASLHLTSSELLNTIYNGVWYIE